MTASAFMEGFFNRANVMVKAMASAFAATTQEAPAKALIPPSEPIPAEESTYARKVFSGESAPILVEFPTPQKEITPTSISQTESTSSATPLVIFASDALIALSQAVKDCSSLVVTPSSIPSLPPEDLMRTCL